MDVPNHVGGLEVGNFTKHKAIGKNGSFWLPPAVSEGSFSNKLNSFRTQSKSPRVGVKSDVIDQNRNRHLLPKDHPVLLKQIILRGALP